MDTDPVWGNIFKNFDKKEESEIDILLKIPLFEGLKKKEMRFILKYLHPREYKVDELIIEENKPGVGMYIILEGKVQIFFKKGNKTLAVLGRGEFFGEMALLQESPRSASVKALEQTRLLGLFQPDILGLIDRKPHLGNTVLIHLAQMIAERLRFSNDERYQLQMKLAEYEKK